MKNKNEQLSQTPAITRDDLYNLLMNHLNRTVFKNGETPEQKQQMFEIFQSVTGISIQDDLDEMEVKVKNGATLESLQAEYDAESKLIQDEFQKIPLENFTDLYNQMKEAGCFGKGSSTG